jgi:hypothetical protein
MSALHLIGRSRELFTTDLEMIEDLIMKLVNQSRFLI